MVEKAEDPLKTAVMLAITGNVIDFGANPQFRLEEEIQEVAQKEPTINHYEDLEDRLAHAREILYIGDNAGETVFDRVLIETLGKPVTFVVREGPIINDATREDATKSGLDKVATVVSSGCDAPGTVLSRCTGEFLDHFERADLIISKGQGNYETLSGENRPIFHLLKAKCPVIAKDLGVEVGDWVIKYSLHHIP
jgi:uncharacterized protein with ATP-grasp and redox domains